MNNFLILNITYDHILYNFFDCIKNRIAFKEGVELFNLYNGTNMNFIPQYNDFFYKNDTSDDLPNFNPADYEVKHVYEMFKKFYFFCKENINILEHYRYIIRCNSSTFLNIKKLKETLTTLPSDNCYAGYKLNHILASGACNIFSIDVIKKIIETELEQIPYKNNYDDVAISNLLTQTYQIFPVHVDRYDFSINRPPTPDEVKQALNYSVIRVRNNTNREFFDTVIWNELFKQYVQNYFVQQS